MQSKTLLFALVAGAYLLASPALAASSSKLTVLSPNGGEALIADGTIQIISWKAPTDRSYGSHYFLIPQGDTPRLPPPPPGGSSIAFIEEFGGYSMGGKYSGT